LRDDEFLARRALVEGGDVLELLLAQLAGQVLRRLVEHRLLSLGEFRLEGYSDGVQRLL